MRLQPALYLLSFTNSSCTNKQLCWHVLPTSSLRQLEQRILRFLCHVSAVAKDDDANGFVPLIRNCPRFIRKAFMNWLRFFKLNNKRESLLCRQPLSSFWMLEVLLAYPNHIPTISATGCRKRQQHRSRNHFWGFHVDALERLIVADN